MRYEVESGAMELRPTGCIDVNRRHLVAHLPTLATHRLADGQKPVDPQESGHTAHFTPDISSPTATVLFKTCSAIAGPREPVRFTSQPPNKPMAK